MVWVLGVMIGEDQQKISGSRVMRTIAIDRLPIRNIPKSHKCEILSFEESDKSSVCGRSVGVEEWVWGENGEIREGRGGCSLQKVKDPPCGGDSGGSKQPLVRFGAFVNEPSIWIGLNRWKTQL
ncbi:hypothetical protein AVEN_207122-1 [Araneus ventricosus]|uniref:Uncharacterized protein n=1 Tax=Araneus ventricosus TaxID=182803 RepID=A0A4Y2JHP1_ARAVE|nr:hypothetical protein AVEN_207122-1 [Araneus ventricosus]